MTSQSTVWKSTSSRQVVTMMPSQTMGPEARARFMTAASGLGGLVVPCSVLMTAWRRRAASTRASWKEMREAMAEWVSSSE